MKIQIKNLFSILIILTSDTLQTLFKKKVEHARNAFSLSDRYYAI